MLPGLFHLEKTREMTIDYLADRPTAALDTECYVNYWSVEFRDIASERARVFELYEGNDLDIKGIVQILRKWRLISFNGYGYDMPMLALAVSGASNALLKQASDDIIQGDLRPWQFQERYGVSLPDWVDHIDVQQVSPGAPTMPSLKIYSGRLHSRKMQDLPIKPDARILPNQRIVMRTYLSNDTQVTKELGHELRTQLALRASMSVQYGLDLRSKSDAQIAEAVIKSEVEKLTGRKVYRPDIKPGSFQYIAPDWIEFQTEQMREIFAMVVGGSFMVTGKGVVLMPEALEKTLIHMGSSAYQMGIGGLHSTEESAGHVSDEYFVLLDRDVTSYYPSIILNNRFTPKHMGDAFLKAYRTIFDRRLSAKASGDKDVAESLKIVLNGSFGKFGSPYSVLYSPNLMVQTTITGQLAILMLIEALELRGIPVISGNTDGIVSKVAHDKRDLFNAVVFDWECQTSFNTEETEYRALYSRDVNNYIAIKPDGKVKLKGAFTAAGPGLPAAMGLKKNPTAEICTEAVVALLTKGTPLEETVAACTDIRKFVAIKRVTGGGEKDGEYLGKAVRWYYGYGETGPITYVTNGNTVPKTEGAVPCMELPDELPDNIDYEWYVREATAMLDDVGVGGTQKWGSVKDRSGIVLAHLPDQKNIHQVDIADGAALCGLRPKSARVRWTEYRTMPAGHRGCPKCKKASEL